MRKYLLAAAAVAAIATPAMARDGQPYVGIEGGLLKAKGTGGDIFVDYTTTQTPATPSAGTGPADFTGTDAFDVDYKRGTDLDVVLGYDFGLFRLEAEVARKAARFEDFDASDAFLSSLNTGLNRPSAAPDPGAPGLPALVNSDFDIGGRVKVRSLMANALLDFGNNGLSFYAGAGAGRADIKRGDFRDGAWAYQAIAGVRYAVTRNIDLGLKYRYFRTGKVDISDNTVLLQGNANRTAIGTTTPVNVDQTSTAVLFSDLETRFKSHSLLASLIFNFGGAEAVDVAPEPVAAPPAPEPAPAPATQTCADGSVILATDACPAPVAPPAPATGERG